MAVFVQGLLREATLADRVDVAVDAAGLYCTVESPGYFVIAEVHLEEREDYDAENCDHDQKFDQSETSFFILDFHFSLQSYHNPMIRSPANKVNR
jgi:hypothetical protein